MVRATTALDAERELFGLQFDVGLRALQKQNDLALLAHASGFLAGLVSSAPVDIQPLGPFQGGAGILHQDKAMERLPFECVSGPHLWFPAGEKQQASRRKDTLVCRH